MRRALALLLGAGLVLAVARMPGAEPSSRGPLARLLGPVAQVAAGWQWVRVRMALDAGRPGLAYARAERAFELDPRATGPWSFLAAHYAHDRAAPDDEPDPALRASWVRAALALLERGESSARQPAELALHRGLLLVHVGDLEGEIPWEGGTLGAWREAEAAFEDARRLDPGGIQVWAQLARHRVLRLGSERFVSSAEERLEVLRDALELLEQGRATSRSPGQLDFERGLLLGLVADGEDGPAWPGGRAALYAEALVAFEAAERGGVPMAHEAEHAARAALEALREDG